MSDVAIRVEGLGKKYRLQATGERASYRTLRDEVAQLPSRLRSALRAQPEEEFWALCDVSFEVQRGEVLGVIGRNGAGKSTLLKILSRIVEPTTGGVDLHGRVGSLLEVGTGFHPELTGRENVFLSGAMLGMRRHEVRARLDEIVAFAEVEKFLDTPCKHYSSGMYTRLGFAVAAHLDTEILLVDEVLAVGDAEFKQRCGLKMRQLASAGGRAIILVSHEPALIRSLCSRVLLLNRGRHEFSGTPEQALASYHKENTREVGVILDAITRLPAGLRIDLIRVGGNDARRFVLPANATYLDVEIEGTMDFSARMELEVRLYDRDGNTLAFFSPGHDKGSTARRAAGAFRLAHRMILPRLLRGWYSLRLGLVDPNFTSWLDVPEAVLLEAEGAGTKLGMLSGGVHCGWMLLDEGHFPSSENTGDSP
jgi:lipopolysaccharide transport system ATP-binding protein